MRRFLVPSRPRGNERIQGDCQNPVVLETVRIEDGSSLSCMTLGKDVKLGKNVTQKEVKRVE